MRRSGPRTILEPVKSLAALLLVLALCPAFAQQNPGRFNGQREFQHPMPPPERRMGWEDRQRLREQVRNGQMTRDEARQRWREQRGVEPGRFSPEQREQLRRDVQDANRDLERR
jgi:hypothetical protein